MKADIWSTTRTNAGHFGRTKSLVPSDVQTQCWAQRSNAHKSNLEGHVWEQYMVIHLYTYQLMLSVLNLTSLICWFFQYTPHVWWFFWCLNRQRWLKWLTTWPAMVFLGPPAEKIETAGDPREFVEPELWRIQQLLFIVSPTIWIPLGA